MISALLVLHACEAPPQLPPPPPPVLVPAEPSGEVVISGEGEVLQVDGVLVGQVPLRLRLPAGPHHLELYPDGGALTIEVSPAQKLQLRVEGGALLSSP